MQHTWVWSLAWEDPNPLEKAMATHSSILSWRIPWTEEPGSLQSMRFQRFGYSWETKHIHTYPLKHKMFYCWQCPIFSPFGCLCFLVSFIRNYCLIQHHEDLPLSFHFVFLIVLAVTLNCLIQCNILHIVWVSSTDWFFFMWISICSSLICWKGEGNVNPLQYSCLENPRDRGAWWAAVYGVAQSWTQLKWISSSICWKGYSFPITWTWHPCLKAVDQRCVDLFLEYQVLVLYAYMSVYPYTSTTFIWLL